MTRTHEGTFRRAPSLLFQLQRLVQPLMARLKHLETAEENETRLAKRARLRKATV